MSSENEPTPSKEDVLTVLSIDGGGVKGIIPAIFLKRLEEELQKLKQPISPNARIADYFDVIAGTSTGGLITAMLTTPDRDNNNRPKFTAEEIVQFYKVHSKEIFSPRNWIHCFWKPKYNGKSLKSIVEDKLGNTKLCDTVTDIVIPTFDINKNKPHIFSNIKGKKTEMMHEQEREYYAASALYFRRFKRKYSPNHNDEANEGDNNVKLSDICIGTTAAPSYFPPHPFKHDDGREFHLIDGGVIANNPALVATTQASDIRRGLKSNISGMAKPNLYEKIYLVSLGTGLPKPNSHKDDANWTPKWAKPIFDHKNWGKFAWARPLIDFALNGAQDVVDYHFAVVYQAISNTGSNDGNNASSSANTSTVEGNRTRVGDYIKFQTDQLEGTMTEMDCATEANIGKLAKLAEDILLPDDQANRTIRDRQVKRLNLETLMLEDDPNKKYSYSKAIEEIAQYLYDVDKIKQQFLEREIIGKQRKEREEAKNKQI